MGGVSVVRQSVRQEARRSALDARDRLRAARADRDRRREALVVEVLVAVRERQQADARAGGVVRRMLKEEHMSITEVAAWCGGEVTVREVSRLRHLAEAVPTIDARSTDMATTTRE
jgi:hypothetical protein